MQNRMEVGEIYRGNYAGQKRK